MNTYKLSATSTEQAARLADMLSLPFVIADRDPPPDSIGRRGFWRDDNTDDYAVENAIGVSWARRSRRYYARLGTVGGGEVGFLETLAWRASERCRRSREAGGGP